MLTGLVAHGSRYLRACWFCARLNKGFLVAAVLKVHAHIHIYDEAHAYTLHILKQVHESDDMHSLVIFHFCNNSYNNFAMSTKNAPTIDTVNCLPL